MKHKIVCAAILVLSLTTFSVHAALVTSLSNLNIGGTLYNATFHRNVSFELLFDADRDGVFGEADASIINRAPNFLMMKPAHR